ncbi:MAG: NAD(P)/FAD-dependent oxidoreductase [Chloroflexi bacterium]|nr:NAD(P)/FAD-dependent oxidoreductase [Chloroflexota bacterium]MCY3697536.1 NAD(P)/FAD-dependent oxidoreductase [Chloroflexota bacterium]
MREVQEPQYDAIVIGAGVAGIYQIYRLQELGMSATVLEAADGPGGTWYWNRYPGARFDSESYTYGYSFSKDLLDEWDWSEHFAGQPETLRYLNHVVDKFDLRKHMQFGCKVEGAEFDEDGCFWRVRLEDGREFTGRFLLTAIGMLSAATLPRIEGLDDFEGESWHTYYWPHEPVELAGKHVAVIGTGATGVQVISEIADKVGELTVFQRRPNWCAPLHNDRIDEESLADIKSSYDEIFEICRRNAGGFLHSPDPRKFQDVPREERLELWEKIYAARGFSVWMSNFIDTGINPEANAEYSAFIADKIRSRVHDSDTAELLIPKDHGFGTRRVPLETRYYEAYNRENVHLVDINETPIERITTRGLRTAERDYEFDLIIYATGFDAITGAFDRMNMIGSGGLALRDKWSESPDTLLGMQTSGFPNLLMLSGPQGGSVSTNYPRGIETAVDWISDLLVYMRDHGYRRVEANAEAESSWRQHVQEMYQFQLMSKVKSWFTGYNSNVDGHDVPRLMIYPGGAPRYRERLEEVAANDYEGFHLS